MTKLMLFGKSGLTPGPPSAVTPISVQGEWFQQRGQRWIYAGCTDFRLLEMLVSGHDIGDIVKSRVALANGHQPVLRVLAMAWNLFALDPDHYPDSVVTDLFGTCNDLGAVVELVALADTNIQGHVRSIPWQQQHYARMCGLCDDRNFVELYNEWNVQWQHGDPSKFTQGPVVTSHGSPGAGGVIPKPFWSYVTWHPERGPNWLRTYSKELFDLRLGGFRDQDGSIFPPVHCPLIANELMGFDEVPAANRSSDPTEAFKAGVFGALLGGGCTFHSTAGLQSQPFGPVTTECARRFFQGVSTWRLWQ